LCVSDVDHPISYNQRATARTSAKRIPQSCRALSTSRSDAEWAGDTCESEVTSAPDSAGRMGKELLALVPVEEATVRYGQEPCVSA
jgi:hypothetical protein